MITHIYFDWSGTLAYPFTREIFLYGKDKLSVLYPDTIATLKYLINKGYILGIISNTSKSRSSIVKSLEDTGLIQYFKGAIMLSSDKDMCKKGCKKIFQTALQIDKIDKKSAVMVGNNYEKDVVGAKEAGLGAVYIDREKKYYGTGVENLRIYELAELSFYF